LGAGAYFTTDVIAAWAAANLVASADVLAGPDAAADEFDVPAVVAFVAALTHLFLSLMGGGSFWALPEHDAAYSAA
jgi:hypothetical protein